MTKNKTKTKVYFWLKFDKKFFDNLFIKRLRNMSGGYAMTVIYIRLMLESLETDCVLYYEGYLDNLIQELALKLDVSEDDVSMTMAYFTKCGLIQIDTDGNAKFPQAEALLEQETNWARYQRENRKNRKVGQSQTKLDNVQPMSNQCPTEIELEKEKELDIETEVEVEVEESNRQISATTDTTVTTENDFNIFQYYQERIGMLNGFQYEEIEKHLVNDGMEPDLIKIAIDKAADGDRLKKNFNYINSILTSWARNDIKTVEQQIEEQRIFEGRKNTNNQRVKFGPACSKY